MNINATKLAIGAGFALGIASSAQAQTVALDNPPMLSFSTSADRDMWHGILIASVVVGVIGIVADNGSLIIIGVAGAVVSLAESESSRLRYQAVHRGIDLASYRSLSFGISPLGGFGNVGVPGMKPAAYAQLSFKM